MFIRRKHYDELNARIVELSRDLRDTNKTAKVLMQVINSLEEDLKSIREEAYKTAKKELVDLPNQTSSK